MKKVAIVYGWSEGSWQSKEFRKALVQRNFSFTDNLKEADIVVAHSAGCYFIPKDINPELIMLIGLGYWPGKSNLKSVYQNIIVGMKNHGRNTNVFWWINKLAHNYWYILSRPIHNYRLIRRMDTANLPNENVILVRNQKDTFCHPDIQKLLPQTQKYKFVELPGDHEDCWLHPERYIRLFN